MAEGLTLNIDDLDLNEVIEIEEEFGKPIGEVKWTNAKDLRFLVWVFLKRDNPDLTLEDAGKQKLAELAEDEPERPTRARNGNGGQKRKTAGARSSGQ